MLSKYKWNWNWISDLRAYTASILIHGKFYVRVMSVETLLQTSNEVIELFSMYFIFFFSDLFGLVVFLGIEPYCVKHWWVRLLYRPYCKKNPQHLYSFIAKILWRSAKKDVIDQVSTISFYWYRYYKRKETTGIES